MMLLRRVEVALLLVMAATVGSRISLGEIRQLNEAYWEHPGSYWEEFPPGYVTIIAAKPDEPFEFESGVWQGEVYSGPADIQSIVADEDLGDVTVTLVGHDGHEFGADNVGEIILWADGTTGTLAAMSIAGDFGAVGPLEAPSAGDINIGGSAVNDLGFWSVGDVTVDGTLDGQFSSISAGDIHVGGDVVMPSTITTAIDISGAISQPLTIGGQLLADLTCESAADITLSAPYANVLIFGPRTGNLTIGAGSGAL